ncbi:MAG: hypothetical protein AAF716_01775 [Cyanobacteria bacterium P01_D01_bin.1]
MEQSQFILKRPRKGIDNSRLILLGFATAFFPRLLSSFGAPSVINFAHFGVIPVVVAIALITTRTRDFKRRAIVSTLLLYLLALFTCYLASTLLNNAGIVNIVLQFLFTAEPFLLLAGIIAVPIRQERLQRFRYWLLGFVLFNFLLAIAQSILIPAGIYPKPQGGTIQDNITGVFGGGGGSAANYVSCTVSLYFSVYFLGHFKHLSVWARYLPLVGALYQTQVSDSKQVFLALAVGWGLMALTKTENPTKLLSYALTGIVFIIGFSWALQNLNTPFLAPYQNWTNRSIWGWDGLAAQTKFAAFRIIPSHYETPLNWLFGLGPGHSVSRLGGWVFRDYETLLLPLGGTVHPASAEVFQVVRTSYLPQESTVYFPLFTWAGIWGDSGFVGLAIYIALAAFVWTQVCVDDLGRFMLLSTACFGLILTQMEEPGHMLTVSCLLGLRWQEHREQEEIRRALRDEALGE